ncbi:MAG TPA: hypothetical protein VIM81_14240 [Gammaproteobacteria bacterium]
MNAKWLMTAVCLSGLAGCGQPADVQQESSSAAETTETDRESVFDPLTETLDRAEGVEDTLREQSEELRRRVEEAE